MATHHHARELQLDRRPTASERADRVAPLVNVSLTSSAAEAHAAPLGPLVALGRGVERARQRRREGPIPAVEAAAIDARCSARSFGERRPPSPHPRPSTPPVRRNGQPTLSRNSVQGPTPTAAAATTDQRFAPPSAFAVCVSRLSRCAPRSSCSRVERCRIFRRRQRRTQDHPPGAHRAHSAASPQWRLAAGASSRSRSRRRCGLR